jgi:uncharacterized protein (TIGR03437 family)
MIVKHIAVLVLTLVWFHADRAEAQQYEIATVAGGTLPSSGVPAVQVSIGDPPRVAVDSSGNTYFGSLDSVFEVDRLGTLIRIAGTGRRGYSGDGGSAVNAQMAAPNGIAVDAGGNTYVAEEANHVIRKISAAGLISTYAGTGAPGFSGDGGQAINAQLNAPNGLALDSAGNLYIADKNNNRIRVVAPDGHISSFAGNGFPGYSGDGGAARDSALNSPEGVALDISGRVFIADTQNDRVRVVAPDGTIATFAGIGNGNVLGDGGPAVSAGLILPAAVAVDRAGNVYITDLGHSRIRVVSPAGAITTAVGSDKGAPLAPNENAVSVRLNGPTGVAVDANGNIYFTEGSIGSGTNLAHGDYRVWKVTPDSILTAFAGNGIASYSGDGGASTNAQLRGPTALALDTAGNLYIADTQNHRVRKVTPAGIITTIAGTGTAGFSGDGGPAANAQLNAPQGVAVDSAGFVVISDTGNSRIRKISPDGIINNHIGNGNASYFGDGGPAYLGSVNHPEGIAVDPSYAVYIADTLNHVVRKAGTDGTIKTIAGRGVPGFSGDGGPATSAQLKGPTSVALDNAGNLYIVDTGNQRIRKVGPDGTITTVASLSNPNTVATDASGNVYASTADRRIWLLPGSGSPTAIAGTGDCCYTGDGGPALNARLYVPWGLVAGNFGRIYIADPGANAVRLLLPSTSGPVLSTVVNGASNLSAPIAPGEVVVLYGTGLGPAQLTQSAYAGTTVLFNGTAGALIYASAQQVSAIAPNILTGPNVQVSVQYGSLATAPVTLPVAAVSPGLFTYDSSGKGQAAATNSNGSLNSSANPAFGTVTLYATGITPSSSLTVTVGGQTATVVSENLVLGVVQVTIQLPSGLQGLAVPMVIQSGSAASQDGVTIAVTATQTIVR